MRVLHLIDSYGLYGAESIALDLVQHQRMLGWDSCFGCIRRPGEPKRPTEEAALARGLTVVEFPMLRGPNLVGGKRIADYVAHRRFDLVHAHTYKGNIVYGLLPRWMRPAPLLITLHGWRPAKRWIARCIQWLESLAIHRADYVIAVSDALARDSRLDGLPVSRVEVISNGISTEEPAVEECLLAQIQSLTANGFSVAAIGRLSAEKGFDLLIRAIADLNDKYVNLIVFGEGEERERLERLIVAMGVESRVRLLGYIPNAAAYLGAFDCVAIPSTTEGCPLVALEGMRAAIPIAASKVGGLPTILQHGQAGLLFPSGDQDALANALLDVRNNPAAARQRTQSARDAFREGYQSSGMQEAYVELYERILAEQQEQTARRAKPVPRRELILDARDS